VLPTPPKPPVENTTHGGVIVTPDGAPNASVPPSPAAYTMASGSAGTGGTRRRGLTPAVAATLGGIVATAAIAAGLVYTRGPHAPMTADPASAVAAPSAPAAAVATASIASLASPVAAESSPPAVASAVPGAVAPDGGEAVAVSPAASTPRFGVAARGAFPRATTTPAAGTAPPATTAKPAASANDPFRGVTGTGL
jgi:hypothetical protein